jgi:carbamoyltransferase
MYILGISCYYHDSAACLIKDGQLIAAAEEERFTRIKHDFSFPYNAIKFCLEYEGIEGRDLDWVVFHEKPFLKFERIIKTILSTCPKSYKVFSEVALNWLKDKLWVKATIAEFLNISENKILFSEHHLSHAASAFFCSPFKKAAILTCDGVGEWATTTLGMGWADWGGNSKNEIKILEEIKFPHSLGLLYSVFTAFLGFKINEGEYKVMGLSSFGEPKYVDRVYELIKVNSNGSIKLNMKYFSYHYSTKHSYNKNFIKLFGKPRKLENRFIIDKNYFIYDNSPITDEEIKDNRRFADIAASIQKVTEEILIKVANYLYQKTKLKKLCMAGGVALNCVANYKILRETSFEEIFIQPSAGDSGAALGAALYVWHCLLNKPRKFILNHAYWGKDYSCKEIKNFLDREGIKYKEYNNEDSLADYVVDALTNQKIIGWFQDRFEWGPRALGNRSILADPSNPMMKDIINLKIKFREPFRPFAPSILYEYTDSIFEIEEIKNQYPFRFMLYTVPIKNNFIPAATHIDNTSRIHIIHRDTNFLYYRVVEKFYKKTGVPAVLNTSFNLKGEPIVNSPFDAYNTFKQSGIDILVLENFVIEKNGFI